jgi:ATP-binding cassette subfamily F protein 3
MLTAHNLSKSYGIQTILTDISFSISPGDRVGLIGPNGCGKTTLMRILAGKEKPDQGAVILTPSSLRVSYLGQGFELDPANRFEEVIQTASGDAQKLSLQVAGLAAELAVSPQRKDLQDAYDAALQALQNLDQLDTGRIAAILQALGLDAIPADLPVGRLSGGQKTRLALALVLVEDPQLLLLDEPTNHLDIQMLEWLEAWLSGFPGAALIVSHDRTFLDHTVNRILDLDPETHSLQEYSGNYSDYLDQYLKRKEIQEAAYKDQVVVIRMMKQDIARTKQQASWVEQTTTSRQPGVRRIAKKVAKKAKSRQKKLDRYMDSDEILEKPKAGWQMKLEFDRDAHLGNDVLSLQDVSVGFSGQTPLLEGVSLHAYAGRRIALTGPNGCGKTTLLRTIAGLLPPLVGRIRLGASVHLGYMAQEQELLDPQTSAVDTIQKLAPLNETDARAFLHFFLFSGDDAVRPSGALSFGERARLALASLVIQGNNFLLLDEPINHLDIPSRTRFEQALAPFDGTILAVVHDRYFIERFATDLWVVEGRKIRQEILTI